MARTFGEMGIREIQTGLAAKEFSAAEVARGTFERIGEADGAVHAFLETTEELALDAAARIDAAVAEGRLAEMGPLAGVPVGYKDNLNQMCIRDRARGRAWATSSSRTSARPMPSPRWCASSAIRT